ncbi:MAG: alkaline phosphatase [Pirellulaceae bacterium]
MLQTNAVLENHCGVAHWGWKSDDYTLWRTHSNRLIPVYTFGTKGKGDGIDLDSYQGAKSPYRDEGRIVRMYEQLPEGTLNPDAEYLDQTNLFQLQQAALESGKKHIILMVFDGMDWQTTQAAAINKLGRVAYDEGRGVGAHFQEYQAGGTTQFGFMVTSPYSEGAKVDVDAQTVAGTSGLRGGYNPKLGGASPWSPPSDPEYLVGKSKAEDGQHAYTDSASSASSMTAGIKTYNAAINVDAHGRQVTTLAHVAQQEGYSVGAVSSVPISHATPAAAYAHNVDRNDLQDLTRDLLGLPSASHPATPLPGLDVLIGGGFGVTATTDKDQGANFVPGNIYLADEDRNKADVAKGGKYVVSIRSEGADGGGALAKAAAQARDNKQRLFGFYGVGDAAKGHLPYATADGDYQPAPGCKKTAEEYSDADLAENPTLAEMTSAALTVLGGNPKGFWLMVEAGDVDWANHDDNLDNSIGAVNSGDAAVKIVTDWVEQNSNWDESLLIVTADHGHYLVLDRPELLVAQRAAVASPSDAPLPAAQDARASQSQTAEAAAEEPSASTSCCVQSTCSSCSRRTVGCACRRLLPRWLQRIRRPRCCR